MAKRETIAGLPAAEYHRQYREARKHDPEWRKKRVEHNESYRQRHPDKVRQQQVRRNLRKYNLTVREYDAMLAAQGGVCAACGGKPDVRYGRLYVDHDHACCPGAGSCGECVRGLLCNACNAALGHVKDDKERLERLIEYLNRHQ